MATGAVGVVIVAIAVGLAVLRLVKAVARNERYRFTTLRWGKLAAAVMLAGLAMKVAVSMVGA